MCTMPVCVCVQIHLLEDGQVMVYSRNQEDNTSKYPDIIARMPASRKSHVRSAVIDSEAVAWDVDKKQILPFQVLSTRKRKVCHECQLCVTSDIVVVCYKPCTIISLFLNEFLIDRSFIVENSCC